MLAAVVGLPGCGEPETTAQPAARRWRLASLNAWGVPFSRAIEERMGRLPAALVALEPDVVCLQEVWLAADRERVAAGLGAGWRVAPASGGGLLLAARHPIAEDLFTPFPAFEGLSVVERMARKGWLEAVVDLPAGRVRVVTTHLAFDGPRHLQLEVLAKALAARTDLPTVLAGDLNLRASEPPVTTLLGAPWRDARPEGDLAPTRVGWPRTGRPGGWAPDHVRVRGLRVLRFALALDAPETALSDHNLLLVDLGPE
jgi:endonuclease/exonuclease/phosphatase family metal-dependent hydrolase